jgi:3-dehydroquinate synthase
MVDVSVAIKNGINFLERRNRLGSYYPPVASLFDKTWLQTLPATEMSSGMGEILKMGIIKDAHLFGLLEQHGADLLFSKFQHQVAEEVIGLAIEGMRIELQDNLLEKNLKRIVDFGHSFSPIIEMRSLTDSTVPSLLHGEAVTLDGIFSCLICLNRKMLSFSEVERVIRTAKKCGLPTYHPSFIEPTLLWEALTDTSKHREAQNLPVPTTIGAATFINDLTYQEVVNAVETFKELQ